MTLKRLAINFYMWNLRYPKRLLCLKTFSLAYKLCFKRANPGTSLRLIIIHNEIQTLPTYLSSLSLWPQQSLVNIPFDWEKKQGRTENEKRESESVWERARERSERDRERETERERERERAHSAAVPTDHTSWYSCLSIITQSSTAFSPLLLVDTLWAGSPSRPQQAQTRLGLHIHWPTAHLPRLVDRDGQKDSAVNGMFENEFLVFYSFFHSVLHIVQWNMNLSCEVVSLLLPLFQFLLCVGHKRLVRGCMYCTSNVSPTVQRSANSLNLIKI